MSDGPEWFAPKRYGYGAGMPISWQGWVLTVGFILVMILLGALVAPEQPLVFLALLIPVIILFTTIAAKTTKGGWRWRWGKED